MTGTKPETRERNERLVARVLDGGASVAQVAVEFGISRQRAQSLVAEHFAALTAEWTALDTDTRALKFRYEAAAALAFTLPPDERIALLVAVIWPSPELAALSRERALSIEQERPRQAAQGNCSGCGIDFDAGYSVGCPTCVERDRSHRRRLEAREQAARTEATVQRSTLL